MEAAIIITTYPNSRIARKMSKKIIESKLAACATNLQVNSIYTWKGSLDDCQEVLVIYKTLVNKLEKLSQKISQDHPYDVPEILQIKPSSVSEGYLKWLKEYLGER